MLAYCGKSARGTRHTFSESATRKSRRTGFTLMSKTLAEQLRSARVIDLEQPRFLGMPIYPSHRPGYFYALHRRHRDSYLPEVHGPRTGASGVLTMMEHAGTHIDALCHQACGFKMFGGITTDSA